MVEVVTDGEVERPERLGDHGRMAMTFPSDERWTLELWSADFVVLYDWLMSLDFSQLPVSHQAEKQALTDLLSNMELQVPVQGVTQEEIDLARSQVSKDMHWE
jgi:hypothetical protein